MKSFKKGVFLDLLVSACTQQFSVKAKGLRAEKRIAGHSRGTQRGSLPLLPPGPDGVRDSLLRRTRLSHLRSICLAERVRFELTVLAYTRVPGVHLKPLGHLSMSMTEEMTVLA